MIAAVSVGGVQFFYTTAGVRKSAHCRNMDLNELYNLAESDWRSHRAGWDGPGRRACAS